MKNREKGGTFANRMSASKKDHKSGHLPSKAAAFLPFYHSRREKCSRKSRPFLSRIRFAKSNAFHVYYIAILFSDNTFRDTRDALLYQICENSGIFLSNLSRL